MSKLSTYLTETREEMKHVTWPTRQQTTVFVILVILISFAIAAYLGFFDYIFSLGLQSII
jgi:preprotein translocase subunit SecE